MVGKKQQEPANKRKNGQRSNTLPEMDMVLRSDMIADFFNNNDNSRWGRKINNNEILKKPGRCTFSNPTRKLQISNNREGRNSWEGTHQSINIGEKRKEELKTLWYKIMTGRKNFFRGTQLYASSTIGPKRIPDSQEEITLEYAEENSNCYENAKGLNYQKMLIRNKQKSRSESSN